MADYLLKIKKLLNEKKITQREFAKKLNITLTTVNNYLTKKTKIDVDTLIKIAEVLNIPFCYLFDDKMSSEDTEKLLEIIDLLMFFANKKSKEEIKKRINELKTNKTKLTKTNFEDIPISYFEILTTEQINLLKKYGYISEELSNVLSYNRLVKTEKNNKKLKEIYNEILDLRKTNFTNLSQREKDSLGYLFKEVEDYVFEKHNVNLYDYKIYPEEFLFDLFG